MCCFLTAIPPIPRQPAHIPVVYNQRATPADAHGHRPMSNLRKVSWEINHLSPSGLHRARKVKKDYPSFESSKRTNPSHKISSLEKDSKEWEQIWVISEEGAWGIRELVDTLAVFDVPVLLDLRPLLLV